MGRPDDVWDAPEAVILFFGLIGLILILTCGTCTNCLDDSKNGQDNIVNTEQDEADQLYPDWEDRPKQWKDAGIIIDEYGQLENTNDFSVRIKCIYEFRGKLTEWDKVVKSNQVITVKPYQHYRYHVITLDGEEIGCIDLGGD